MASIILAGITEDTARDSALKTGLKRPLRNVNLMQMESKLFSLNNQIKKEADEILVEKGLLSVLKLYGIPCISGSYSLDLMTWRDLDIYLEVEHFSESDFFDLGHKLLEILKPVKMSYRNEIKGKTEGLPCGLYWGIYLGNERNGSWKIDVWAVSHTECSRLVDICTFIKDRLTPENSAHILNIKEQCWQDNEYRKSYTSMDIYNAVLERGITTIGEFRKYLKSSGNLF